MTDTATQAGLAALEPLQPVIDPKGKLNKKTKTGCYQSRSEDDPAFSMPVWPEDALAHLEKKAREWIEKWCREHDLALRIVMEAGRWIVNIAGELYGGDTYAVALANTIAALQEHTDD